MSSAVVTGAGGGLGRAIAIRLAADGHAIAALDIAEDDAAETCALIEAAGGTARPFVVDLRDEATLAATMEQATEKLGPLAVLVNNAAVFPSGPFVEVSPAEYDLSRIHI